MGMFGLTAVRLGHIALSAVNMLFITGIIVNMIADDLTHQSFLCFAAGQWVTSLAVLVIAAIYVLMTDTGLIMLSVFFGKLTLHCLLGFAAGRLTAILAIQGATLSADSAVDMIASVLMNMQLTDQRSCNLMILTSLYALGIALFAVGHFTTDQRGVTGICMSMFFPLAAISRGLHIGCFLRKCIHAKQTHHHAGRNQHRNHLLHYLHNSTLFPLTKHVVLRTL